MGLGRTLDCHAFGLAVVSVKRVVRTYRHIKTGWCSARRVAHLGMAAAWNRHAADDGASNLWLCSSGSLRVTLVMHRRRAGRYQRKCKHSGRNNGSDCFHRDPLTTHEGFVPRPHTNRQSSFSPTHALMGNTVRFGCWGAREPAKASTKTIKVTIAATKIRAIFKAPPSRL